MLVASSFSQRIYIKVFNHLGPKITCKICVRSERFNLLQASLVSGSFKIKAILTQPEFYIEGATIIMLDLIKWWEFYSNVFIGSSPAAFVI